MLEKIGDKNRYNKKIIIFILIIAVFFTLISYAASDVTVKKIVENGVQYIYFELNHNITTAAYKYFGYGYHVTIYDNYGKEIGYKFLINAEFEPKMIGGVETVKIPIESLYNKTDVEGEYYYRKDCTIWLNGRLGTKVNGILTHLYDSLEGIPERGIDNLATGYATYDGQTVPLNKDEYGIKNGINHEYGVSWSLDTQINLKQHFGIHFTLDPIYIYDGYKVQYHEVATGKTVSSEKTLMNFNESRPITEYPDTVNGYEYSSYYEIKKVDNIGNITTLQPLTQGDSATVNLQQTASIYTIVFYYNKVDPSTIGNPVTINVEYRESTSDGKKLMNNTTAIGGDLSQFNFNSAKIDDYTCMGHYVMGQATEYFYTTKASFIIGKEGYSKPVDGILKIIFIYEKIPYVSIPKCSPSVYSDADTVNISMKKKDFENATDISVNNAVFKIKKFECGENAEGDSVEGTHEFSYFDLYIDKYNSSYDNKSKEIIQSFIVPKNIFAQSATDTNLYTSNIDVTYAAFCTCFDGKPDSDGNRGMAVDNGNIIVNITLIENKPPDAYFDYYTEKKLEDGSKDQIYRAYINHETIINNQATDPNGATDIKKLKYTLKDSNNNQYYVNLLMLGNETYFLDDNNINANNIVFQGITDYGDLKLKFLTSETWTVTQYVEDSEGLNDTYVTTITPETLSLNPLAVISDNISYRFPRANLFSGKQNRVIQLNSNSSYVCDYLKGTGITINHNRDCWEIVPLDEQDLTTVKFEKNITTEIEDNILKIKYVPLSDIKMMFKEYGRYKFRLQVSDSDGNVSNWTEQILTIKEDEAPIVTATLNTKYYRNATTKKSTITFNALSNSTDEDYTEIKDVKYKYDSNNDGSYNDETAQYTNLTSKNVIIDGITYRQITLITNSLGNYQFEVEIKEEFGQETLNNYIDEIDYKTGSTYVVTKVDNIAPVGTLGLQKESNIDVKVLTCGLSDTQDATVANSIDTLNSLVESQYNINCGDIEIVNMANSKNGLLNGNALTWKRVTMGLNNSSSHNGLLDNKIAYIDKEYTTHGGDYDPIFGCCLDLLPSGVYATGWNGIELPHMWVRSGLWNDASKKDLINHYAIGREYYIYPGDDIAYVLDNAFSILPANNYVRKGYLGSYYGWVADMDFSAISNEKIRDFDISFDFTTRYYKYHGIDDHCYTNMFLFDVQDSNNYYAVYTLNCNSDYCTYKDYERHTGILYNHEGIHDPSGIVKVKNGVIDFVMEYSGHTKDDGMCPIERIKKLGDTVTAYNSVGTQVIQFAVDDSFSGKSGYLGLGTQGNDVIYSQLNIGSLTYLDNSSIYDSIDKLSWGKDTDKYIINIVADNKLDEITNSKKLIQTATKLQTKAITLINVGVSSVNATKLKQIVTRNDNNGTYIELGDISTNLTSAAAYIRNKYSDSILAEDYILLGSTVKYIENYSDTELDPIYSKLFKFYQIPTYFDNNLGTISNNNVWEKNSIETFNKTGKYTLNYQVRDNPLSNTDEMSLFDEYRKYSSIYSRLLYVHRKPIASFNIDRSFANNLLQQYSQNYDDIFLRLQIPPKPTAYEIVYDAYDYDLYNDYTWFFKYFEISSAIGYRNYYEDLDDDWRYDGTFSEPICDPNDRDFYNAKSSQLKSYLGIRTFSAYQDYYEDLLDEYYNNIDYRGSLETSISVDVNIPTNAINATVHYITNDNNDSPYTIISADGVEVASVNDDEDKIINIPSGTQTLVFASSGSYTKSGDYISFHDIYTHYYTEDTNINIPVTENSYDLDHTSLSSKGIAQWQWKVVCKDGTTTLYNATNKSSGTSWVSTQLKNQKWHDASILLRVKDLEGAYSDWTSAYISEDNLLDPNADNTEISISPPIADFVLAYDELNYKSQSQVIYDGSSDPQGLALVYSWKVYKEDALILSSSDKNINSSLNEKILANGTGKYSVKLMVVNTKGLKSEEITKYFNVVLYNDAPTVNFNLVSNENPAWTFPKILGLFTLKYRPSNTLFSEEHARFDTNVNDPNSNNTGIIYNWKLERFAVKDINNISGIATNTYNYTTQFPFVNSFKNQGLSWGAYRITLKATDKPPIPPYASTDAKSAEITKYYYIVPETSLIGSFQSSKSEVMVGDTITLEATSSKLVDSVDCIFNSKTYSLSKSSEDASFIYWKKDIVIPDNIESGTYNLQFIGKTTYGGNGNVTREIKDNAPIDIVALKLINFRITSIVNHPYITFPYTKDMLISNLIPYKTGYNVTFQIDSKGKPDNVYGRIDVGNNGTIDQNITLTKVATGDKETWLGKFYTPTLLPSNTVISIKLDCEKGTTTYNYNEKEIWDGRSLVIKGSALQDGRINLTN